MQNKSQREKLKRIALDLPAHKHQEIKIAATALGMTIKDFVEEALYAFSEKLKEQQKETQCQKE